MIKALIAGSGGIVAAGFVPEKWLKPVVKSGVLPAHAQASAPEPTATPAPTQTPDYIQGGYDDFRGDSDFFLAFAYVSSQPFPENTTGVNAPSLAKVQVIANPVEGKEVTLFIDDVKYVPIEITDSNPKKTDADGYVKWELEWDYQQLLAINPNKETRLKFVMVDGSDEVIFPGFQFN